MPVRPLAAVTVAVGRGTGMPPCAGGALPRRPGPASESAESVLVLSAARPVAASHGVLLLSPSPNLDRDGNDSDSLPGLGPEPGPRRAPGPAGHGHESRSLAVARPPGLMVRIESGRL